MTTSTSPSPFLERYVLQGNPWPHQRERWLGLLPEHFLRFVETAPFTAPELKKQYESVAYFHVGIRNGTPGAVHISPAWQDGYYWIRVEVEEVRPGKRQFTRFRLVYCYPTVVAAEDVPDALTSWGLKNLRWETSPSGRLWSVTRHLRQNPFQGTITYFAISEDRKYLTVGRANVVPSGAPKLILRGLPNNETDKLKLVRLGICRLSQDKAETIVQRYTKLAQGVWIRHYNGSVWNVNDRVLARIAKSCARHYRKYIIDGKRNLLAPYMEPLTK